MCEGLVARFEDANDLPPIDGVSKRAVTRGDAVDEVRHLVSQRFGDAQSRNVQVAPTKHELKVAVRFGAFPRIRVASPVRLARCWYAIDALVVHLNDAVGVDVVIDDHLPRTNDDDLAHLVWIKPRDVDVCGPWRTSGDVWWVLKGDEGDVLDARLEVCIAGARGARGAGTRKEAHNAQVVRGQVPHHIDILANLPKVEAPRV